MEDKLEQLFNATKQESLRPDELASLERGVGSFIKTNPAVPTTVALPKLLVALVAVLGLAGGAYYFIPDDNPMLVPPPVVIVRPVTQEPPTPIVSNPVSTSTATSSVPVVATTTTTATTSVSTSTPHSTSSRSRLF